MQPMYWKKANLETHSNGVRENLDLVGVPGARRCDSLTCSPPRSGMAAYKLGALMMLLMLSTRASCQFPSACFTSSEKSRCKLIELDLEFHDESRDLNENMVVKQKGAVRYYFT